MKPGSLRSRIVALTLLPVVLVGGPILARLTELQLDSQRQAYLGRGQSLAGQLAHAVAAPLAAGDRARLHRLAFGSLTEPDVQVVTVETLEGAVLAREARLADPGDASLQPGSLLAFEASVQRTDTPAGEPQIGAREALSAGSTRPIGRVRVELSPRRLDAQRSEVLQTTLGYAALALALIALLSVSLARLFAEPLHQLGLALGRLRQGRYDLGLPADGSGEFGDLAADLRALAQQLAEQRRALSTHDEHTLDELRVMVEELEMKNAELDIARKRALQASRVKSEFLANMSHEIRTPMNGVMGFIELLAKTELSRTQQGYLHTIRASAQNLMTILNDILDFSKIEAGKLQIIKRPLDLRAILENAVLLFAPNAHAKGLSLVLDIAPEVPSALVGDGPRIAQIVTNFVSNAVKFTDHGEIEVCVRKTADSAETMTITITVRDTGIGISAADQERLFKAFDQLAPMPRRSGGTGLGLTICRRLVTMMNGQIHAESVPKVGSTFQVSLPLERSGTVEAPPAATGAPPAHVRVLALSRDRLLLRALDHVLKLRGLRLAATANDLFEVLRALREQPPGARLAVFVDLHQCEQLLQPLAERLRAEDALVLIGAAEGQGVPNLAARVPQHRIARPPTSREVLPLLVPLLAPPHGEARAPATEPGRLAGSVRVLLVDDNLINRQLARIFLSRLGATVDEAGDGLEALEACRGRRYDLVLLDIHMPELDGLEAAARIRAEGPNHDTPILALSAEAAPQDLERYRRAGIDGHLAKPITEEALAGTLRHWGQRQHGADPAGVRGAACRVPAADMDASLERVRTVRRPPGTDTR